MEFAEKILQNADKWNLELSKEQAFAFEKYYHLLFHYNKQFNLTRITGAAEVLEEHFFDSLAGFSKGLERAGNMLLDLGSGAGFPGLPIKIYMPEIKLFIGFNEEKVFLKKLWQNLTWKMFYSTSACRRLWKR